MTRLRSDGSFTGTVLTSILYIKIRTHRGLIFDRENNIWSPDYKKIVFKGGGSCGQKMVLIFRSGSCCNYGSPDCSNWWSRVLYWCMYCVILSALRDLGSLDKSRYIRGNGTVRCYHRDCGHSYTHIRSISLSLYVSFSLSLSVSVSLSREHP